MLSRELISYYREILKVESDKVDVYVPSNDIVLAAYNKIKEYKELKLVFLVLMTSGIRYIECLQFLNEYDIDKFRIFNNFVSYTLSDNRKTKNVNNVYLPLFVYNKLFHISVSRYDAMRIKFVRVGSQLSLKYLRKWHYNFLLYNNVPESVADFIQGRASNGVSANHYLAKAQQAEHWYSKVVFNLEKLFHNKKVNENQYAHSKDTIFISKKGDLNYSKLDSIGIRKRKKEKIKYER